MGDAMWRIIPSIAVRRLPVVFWSSINVDPTNHGLRQSVPSNPVDPIQPQIEKDLLTAKLYQALLALVRHRNGL